MATLLRTRLLPALCAALFAGAAPALDTPLVVVSGQGMGTINAASGQVSIYELRENRTERKGLANVLTDLRRLQLESAGMPGFTALRTGWPAGQAAPKPTPEELIRQFRKDPTPEQRRNGKGSDQEAVRKAEDEFWAKDHPYDGVLRGALGAQLLMVAVPGSRAVLFYRLDNQRLTLSAAYNYSPALYVQLAYNSTPDPLSIARNLELTKEQQSQLSTAMQNQDEGGVVQAAASEVWCCASGNFYVLVDTANHRIAVFEDMGRSVALRSVRNLSADLLIPVGYNSGPNAAAEAVELPRRVKEAGALIKELGLEPFDQYSLKAIAALAEAPAAKGGGKAGAGKGLQANCTGGTSPQVVLDFTGERKLLVYNLRGNNNSLELSSVRDYGYDIAVDNLLARVSNRANAIALARKADEQAGKGQAEAALANLAAAFALDPAVVETARKSQGLKRLKGAEKDQAEALLVQGGKDLEAWKARVAAIAEAAAAEREKAATGK